MVELKAYSPEMFNDILSMHISQNAEISDIGLPQLGFIAYIDAKPLAGGFLRMIEGGYAMIDTLVSDAQASSQQRHEGMTTVVAALIQTSKDLKLKGILCHTRDEGVLKRAASLGFKVLPQTIIALPL